MDDSWACSAAYVYALHLSPSDRAWEYLRRNPRYQRDWAHHRRGRSQRIAARWGLATLVDPRFDARQVVPMWTIDAPWPVTLVRDEMDHARTVLDDVSRFSLWKLAGRKSLVEDGVGIRLVVNSRTKPVQVRLGGRVSEGDQFAYQIPAAADERVAVAVLTGIRAILPLSGGGSTPEPERPGRAEVFHVRALQVLDGLSVGATQRELAIGLFGVRDAARSWQPDGALRAQVRYLIRRARALMEGEYQALVSTNPADPNATCRGALRE